MLKKELSLLAALCMTISLSACGEESPNQNCTENAKKCENNNIMICKGGSFTLEKQCQTSETCDGSSFTCKPKTQPVPQDCSVDMPKRCENGKLLSCVNGKLDSKDCKHGCQDGACLDKVSECPCKSPLVCVNDKCVPKTSECPCKSPLVCVNDKCVPSVESLAVGAPCRCEGADCTLEISKDELTGIAPILDGLLTGQKTSLTAPNFFATGIKGCEKLVAPEGMTVGCFRKSEVSFPSNLSAVITLMANFIPPEASINLDAIKEILDNGLNFTSTDGYCFTAALNMNGQFADNLKNLVSSDGLNAVLTKIGTGDHEKAKLDANPCPAGSVKFVYDTQKDLAPIMKVLNLGFDICLKSCAQDSDCGRAELSCIDIPNGIPSADNAEVPTQKACFDKTTVDYFKNLKEKLQKKQN